MSIYGHGPTVQEQRIIDLWETGRKPTEIAELLGKRIGYINRVIAMLGSPRPDNWHADARQGSRSLLRALRRVHPDRCGATS